MKRATVEELHFIVPFENVDGIISDGILCYDEAEGVDHLSVANPEVQEIRATKWVPGGLSLHEYANLYFNARNAMLTEILNYRSKQSTGHLETGVLRVSPGVLDLPDVVIADANAAADLTLFSPSPEGLEKLDEEIVFARSWLNQDGTVSLIRKQRMMAEVLVPERVTPDYIERQGYVCCPKAEKVAHKLGTGVRFVVNRELFFNSGLRSHD